MPPRYNHSSPHEASMNRPLRTKDLLILQTTVSISTVLLCIIATRSTINNQIKLFFPMEITCKDRLIHLDLIACKLLLANFYHYNIYNIAVHDIIVRFLLNKKRCLHLHYNQGPTPSCPVAYFRNDDTVIRN